MIRFPADHGRVFCDDRSDGLPAGSGEDHRRPSRTALIRRHGSPALLPADPTILPTTSTSSCLGTDDPSPLASGRACRPCRRDPRPARLDRSQIKRSPRPLTRVRQGGEIDPASLIIQRRREPDNDPGALPEVPRQGGRLRQGGAQPGLARSLSLLLIVERLTGLDHGVGRRVRPWQRSSLLKAAIERWQADLRPSALRALSGHGAAVAAPQLGNISAQAASTAHLQAP